MTQAETLAQEVLLLTRNTLLVNLRFLDAALRQFVLPPAPLPFATDGRTCTTTPSTSCCATRKKRKPASETISIW